MCVRMRSRGNARDAITSSAASTDSWSWPPTPWTRTCLRQADVVLFAARGDAEARPGTVPAMLDVSMRRAELLLLHAGSLDEQFVRDTLNVLLKHESDIAAISPQVPKMVREAVGTDTGGRTASGYPDLG